MTLNLKENTMPLWNRLTITAKAFRSLAARAGWTAAQVLVAGVTVEAFDLPAAWVPVGAVLLSALKSFVAGHVGDPETATFR